MAATRSSAALRSSATAEVRRPIAWALAALAVAGCSRSQEQRPTGTTAAPSSTALATTPTTDGSTASTAVSAAPRRLPRRLRLPTALPKRQVDVPILMYHRIDRTDPSLPEVTRSLTVTPEDFARQMRWLADAGYTAISTRQLFAALYGDATLPRRPVLLTFDDGYRDVLRYAAPILKRYRFHAVAFVITDRISGPDTSFLTWGQLRRLERAGFEIGSHSRSHPDLRALSDSALADQLVGSRRALEERLRHPVQALAYPAGRYDGRVIAAARGAGYVLAVTTRPGREQRARAPFELMRLPVYASTGPDGLERLLRRGR